jgi:hypothetical protein
MPLSISYLDFSSSLLSCLLWKSWILAEINSSVFHQNLVPYLVCVCVSNTDSSLDGTSSLTACLLTKVFSISKNRLTRLPCYIAQASNLTVFHVDHNPIEWPPKHLLEPLANAENAEDSDAMHACIENLKVWIEADLLGPSIDQGKRPESSCLSSDESPYHPQHTSLDSDMTRHVYPLFLAIIRPEAV